MHFLQFFYEKSGDCEKRQIMIYLTNGTPQILVAPERGDVTK